MPFACHLKGGASAPPPPPPPPAPPTAPPPSVEPVMLKRLEQPRVMAQILNNQGVASFDWIDGTSTNGQPMRLAVPMCEGEKGPYRSRIFAAEPFVDVMSRRHLAAWSKVNKKDGTPYDQSYYLVSYNICNPAFTADPAEFYLHDPDMVAGYTFNNLDTSGFRLTKNSPQLMQDAGILRYREQVCASVAMLDADNCDIFPSSDPRYAKFYQNPDDKLPWNEELRQIFIEEVLPKLLKDVPVMKNVACAYQTTNGIRFVFMFDRPVPVLGGAGCLEDILMGMMAELAVAGFAVDTACKDWTRNQKVPRCQKGTKRTEEDPFFWLSWNGIDPTVNDADDPPEALQAFDPRVFPRYSDFKLAEYLHHENWKLITKVLTGGENTQPQVNYDWEGTRLKMELGDCPDDQQVRDLLYLPDSSKHTNEYNVIKNQIKKMTLGQKKDGYRCEVALRLFALIFEGRDILTDFSRVHGKGESIHYGAYFSIWDLCAIMRRQMPSPQMVYALLLEPFLRANQKRAETDPKNARTEPQAKAEVWRAIVKNYPTQIAINQQEEEEESAEEERKNQADANRQREQAGNLHLIKNHLQQWTGQSEEWVEANWRRLLIITSKIGVSVLQIRNGRATYSDPLTSSKEWVACIENAGHTLINYMTAEEEPKVMREADICNGQSTPCGKIIQASRLVKGNSIKFIHEDGVDKLCFVLKLPGVAEDVEPIHHPEIEAYLRLLGGDSVEKLLDWLAVFVRIEKPSPALYIHGDPGIGKGMFLCGLGLLTARKRPAEFQDALGDFQDFFEDTWLLAIDEGCETNQFQKNVVTILRKFIGGHSKQINVKGIKGMYIESEWRLVVMANNDDVFAIKNDLSDQDIEALNSRIFYLNSQINSKAIRDFLHRHGDWHGNEFGPGTEGWPLKIAQHVMWLHQNRKVELGKRFLIDTPPSPWHEHLRVTSAGGLTVCQAIHDCIEILARGNTCDIIHIDPKKGELYLSQKRFEGFVEKHYPKFKGQVSKVVKRLSTAKGQVRIPQEGKKAKYWPRPMMFTMDLPAIVTALNDNGYDTDFRGIFGQEMWETVVPVRIREQYAEDAPIDAPELLKDQPGRDPMKTQEGAWIRRKLGA